MRIIKIKEAIERCGEQITGIHGTLTGVYKRRTGEGQYGPYSFQDGTLKDETGSIIVTFCNHEEMSKRKGMKMTATAKQGEKGMSGLKVTEDEHNGKKTIKLKITETAFIDFGTTPVSNNEKSTDSAPVPAQPAQSNGLGEAAPNNIEGVDAEEAAAVAALEAARKKKAERLKAEAEAKARTASDDRKEAAGPPNYQMAKKRIVQITNLYGYALRAAKYNLKIQGLELTDIYTATATCFIAMREDNLTDAMPMALIEGNSPEEAPPSEMKRNEPPVTRDEARQPEPPEEAYDQEPRTWQETPIHFGSFAGKNLGDIDETAIEMLFSTFTPKADPKTGQFGLKDLWLKNALLTWKKEQP